MPENRSPFRFNLSEYSTEELNDIGRYMHQEFSGRSYGGGRHGSIKIEYPPESICDQETWDNWLQISFLPEWREAHPAVKKMTTIVRFVQSLSDVSSGHFVGGNGFDVTSNGNAEQWIRIALNHSDGTYLSAENYLFVLLHEFIEADVWKKTSRHDPMRHENDDPRQPNTDYNNLTDEKVTNRRVLRALEKLFPGVKKNINKDYLYEEDN